MERTYSYHNVQFKHLIILYVIYILMKLKFKKKKKKKEQLTPKPQIKSRNFKTNPT